MQRISIWMYACFYIHVGSILSVNMKGGGLLFTVRQMFLGHKQSTAVERGCCGTTMFVGNIPTTLRPCCLHLCLMIINDGLISPTAHPDGERGGR